MNTMTRQTLQVPKAAQQFADDATAAGFTTVKIDADEFSVTVWIERGSTSAAAVWSIKTVYDSPLSHERLGFRTSGGKEAVRFDYANTLVYGEHRYHTSLRQARGYVGLPC